MQCPQADINKNNIYSLFLFNNHFILFTTNYFLHLVHSSILIMSLVRPPPLTHTHIPTRTYPHPHPLTPTHTLSSLLNFPHHSHSTHYTSPSVQISILLFLSFSTYMHISSYIFQPPHYHLSRTLHHCHLHLYPSFFSLLFDNHTHTHSLTYNPLDSNHYLPRTTHMNFSCEPHFS